MSVDAGEVQLRIGQQQLGRFVFVARVNSKLAILAAGAHEGVGGCLDADV